MTDKDPVVPPTQERDATGADPLDSDSNSPSPPRTTAPIIGVLCVLIALGTAAIVHHGMSISVDQAVSDVRFTVPGWRLSPPEAQTLAKALAARRNVEANPDDLYRKRLITAYESFNQVDVASRGNVRSERFKDGHAQFQQRANDFITHRGDQAYVALGQQIADQYVVALKEGDKRAIQRLGGTLYRELRGFGLLRTPKSIKAPLITVVQAMLMGRWVRILRELRMIQGLLHPLEHELLQRWKLADHPTLKFKRRLRVGQELLMRKSPYPVLEALGAQAALAHLWKPAAQFYAKAAERRPGDAELKKKAQYARAQWERNKAQR